MSRFFSLKFSAFLLSLLVFSCATYDVQYSKNLDPLHTENFELDAAVDHSFYLIGDAGNAQEGSELTHFKLLKNELSKAPKNTTVLFLGDNLYEKGMPRKNHPERALSEHRIDEQLAIVKNFKGQTIFIPGNHDYYSDGVVGLEREAKYITKKLKDKDTFLPKNGCPITSVDISEDVVLILIDSQWYLENWDKNPTMNNDCSIKTREKFFYEYERLIKKNTLKTTLVAIHHPMYSYGSHGGQYSWKAQLYPIGKKVPLPVVGSLVNLLRKTSGLSPQDMINPIYRELKKRIVTLTRKYDNIIFVSGHEHNLQYIVNNDIPQIISGSGSKQSPARVLRGSSFSYGGKGYAKYVKYKNGASWVYFYAEKNNSKELLFKTEIQPKTEIIDISEYNFDFPDKVSSAIYPKNLVEKSKGFEAFWGPHYRRYYGVNVWAPTARLDTIFGGLTPFRKGGGNQSRSLRLVNAQGKEYVMRAIQKSATQYLQAVAFKNEYIKGEYSGTYTESLLLDIYTTAHPFAPFAIGKLADAAQVYHTNPTLYFVPKQPALQQFNTEYGGELYMIEERASKGHGDLKSFGYSNKLLSSDDFFKNIRKSDDYELEEGSYIRARLFDMLIGDWDRHEDQWRWAEFKEGKKTIYRPVPRDRDQAFSKYDGFLIGAIRILVPGLKFLQVYDKDIKNVKWFNNAPFRIDLALIHESGWNEWETQIQFLQEHITDEVIDLALREMPSEVQDETLIELENKLKGRLKNLPKIAEKYYNFLIKYPIVKGNDKDNLFEINRLENGISSIKVFNIKSGEQGSLIYERNFSKEETKQIWVYGLDDKDIFNVSGVNKEIIKLKLVGGQKNDVYTIKNGKKVTIYDFRSKPNTFTSKKGKKRLFDDYNINLYDYKKYKYNQNRIKPIIGSNPDDGFKIGVTDIFTIYGFERNPFTQQHTIKGSYYFATNGWDLNYDGEFANVFNRWNVFLKSVFTSPNFAKNFYGYGNDSKNFEDEFGKDYHRVRLSTYAVSPMLKWIGRLGAEFRFGPSFESIEIGNTDNRYINTLPIFNEGRNNYVGVMGSYSYENFNETTFPTLGMAFSLAAGWRTNINNDPSENNGFFTPAIGFNYNLTPNGKLILATKFKGNIIIGNKFKFYHAVSIGGLDGLRGYNNHRFTGNTSYYQNTDLRYNLTRLKTKLVPFQIGVFGGFDYGRVWLRGEDSNDWKTSYGGGIWVDAAKLISASLSIFDAKEGVYVRFGLGFGF